MGARAIDLSCPDWEERLRAGVPLTPDRAQFPNPERGDRALAVFDRLRLHDVPGNPTMREACGEWFRSIVWCLFAAQDPETKEALIRELFLLVPKKNSKALALDTLVATPTGFSTIADLQPGDMVIDADGRPTRIVGKSEVFTGRQCYEVEFSTGERFVCDAQHLWVTDAHKDRERQRGDRRTPCPTVKTTAEIAQSVTVKSGALTISNHRTALAGCLDLPDAALPIAPYVLGAWLGDGHSAGARMTAADDDVDRMIEKIRACGHVARFVRRDARSRACTITLAPEGPPGSRVAYRLTTELTKLNLLRNKHVPPVYLRASREQRLELLRGLMDTDGSISAAGQATFVTTSQALAVDVVELVNSLGLKASKSEHRATLKGKDCGPCWLVQFWPFDTVEVFAMPRKLERQRAAKRTNSPRSRTRQIVAVRPVPSVPTQCIGVESETHQFLIGRSLIPTHNTTYGALLSLTALIVNDRPAATLIMTAPVQDTAQLAFEAAAGAIALDNTLRRVFHVREHLKTIEHRTTGASLSIFTFDPRVLTGQKVVWVLLDELHVIAKMPRAESALLQLRGGMVPFPEAILCAITTQSEEAPVGVMDQSLRRARDVRDGKSKAKVLPVLYELPARMQAKKANASEEEWRNPANWPLVTPNVGRSVSIARLEEDYADALTRGEAAVRAWASQHLNLQIGVSANAQSWPGALHWEKCTDKRLAGKQGLAYLLANSEVVTAGVDGGGVDDLLALSFTGRHDKTGEWLHWVHAWALPSVLELRPHLAGAFGTWQEEGTLTVNESHEPNVESLVAYIMEVEDAGLLDRVGVDPAGISDIVQALIDEGITEERTVGIPQGWQLVGAIKTTELRLHDTRLLHAGSALMNYAVSSAKCEPRGNAVIITKQLAGSAKIDPLMATFNAVTLMGRNPKPRKKRFRMMVL